MLKERQWLLPAWRLHLDSLFAGSRRHAPVADAGPNPRHPGTGPGPAGCLASGQRPPGGRRRSRRNPSRNPTPSSAAVQQVHKILDEQPIDAKGFREPISLAKFLAALEKQLPKGTLTLRIDAEAFGDKQQDKGTTRQDVEATLVSLQHLPGNRPITLRTALEEALEENQGKGRLPRCSRRSDRHDPGAGLVCLRL